MKATQHIGTGSMTTSSLQLLPPLLLPKAAAVTIWRPPRHLLIKALGCLM